MGEFRQESQFGALSVPLSPFAHSRVSDSSRAGASSVDRTLMSATLRAVCGLGACLCQIWVLLVRRVVGSAGAARVYDVINTPRLSC
jgi:hypothetical protein